MRCETVIHELSVPSGKIDPSAIAGHLAACSRCASWSLQNEKLQHVWDATRPVEPSSAMFETIWANALARADAPETIAISSAPRWRQWGVVALVAAQAALFLVAGVAALNRPQAPQAALAYDFSAIEGRPLILSLDAPSGAAPKVRVVDETDGAGSGTDMVAADFDVLNFMESL